MLDLIDLGLVGLATLFSLVISIGLVTCERNVRNPKRRTELPAKRQSLTSVTWTILFVILAQLFALNYMGPVEVDAVEGWPSASLDEWAAVAFFIFVSVGYMLYVVGGDILRVVTKKPGFDIIGFLGAVALSGASIVCSCALYYRAGGVGAPSGTDEIYPSDFLYFSMVTFSTLGYGDFQPSGITRLGASFQAVSGNLHLAALIGAIFATFEAEPSQPS